MRRIGDLILTFAIMTMVVALTIADQLRRKAGASGRHSSTPVTTEGDERYEEAKTGTRSNSVIMQAP